MGYGAKFVLSPVTSYLAYPLLKAAGKRKLRHPPYLLLPVQYVWWRWFCWQIWKCTAVWVEWLVLTVHWLIIFLRFLLPLLRCDRQDVELFSYPVSRAEGADGCAFYRAGHTDIPEHVHQVTCSPLGSCLKCVFSDQGKQLYQKKKWSFLGWTKGIGLKLAHCLKLLEQGGSGVSCCPMLLGWLLRKSCNDNFKCFKSWHRWVMAKGLSCISESEPESCLCHEQPLSLSFSSTSAIWG